MKKKVTSYELTEGVKDNWDKDKGIVKNVSVCGIKSRNGYSYAPEALQGVLSQYDNLDIYLDHSGNKTTSRTIGEHFATIKKPYWDTASGAVKCGEFAYRQKHPFASQFEEMLEKESNWFRLSHVAVVDEADIKSTSGGKVITKIVKIKGADLVTNAATTKSLFESFEFVEADTPPPPSGSAATTSSTPNTDAAIMDGMAADIVAIMGDTSLDAEGMKTKIGELVDKMFAMKDSGVTESTRILEKKVDQLTKLVESLVNNPPTPKVGRFLGARNPVVVPGTVPVTESVDDTLPINDVEKMRSIYYS